MLAFYAAAHLFTFRILFFPLFDSIQTLSEAFLFLLSYIFCMQGGALLHAHLACATELASLGIIQVLY